jgi:uncharacterized protein YeaO (DUF488 family)
MKPRPGIIPTWLHLRYGELPGGIPMIQIKRAYDRPDIDDGVRILVDRLWPRGVKKADLKLDYWLKEVSPSDELRKWFGHDAEKWPEFCQRYFSELDLIPERLQPIRVAAEQGTVTLIYAAKDEEHNNAVALQAYLAEH